MAAGIPLFADDAVHQVPLLMGRRPRGECLLHQRVEPFLRVDPVLDHPAVDLAECAGAPQRGQLRKRDAGVVLVHIEQQDPGKTAVQTCGPFQELDPVAVRKVQVDRHKGQIVPAGSQRVQLRHALGS